MKGARENAMQQLINYFTRPEPDIGGSLTPAMLHRLCRKGVVESVKLAVGRGYAADSSLRNGYVRLGLALLALGDPAGARGFFEQDLDAGRLSPEAARTALAAYAKAVCLLDGLDVACELIETLYAEHPDLRDVFAGLAPCAATGADRLALYERDLGLHRLTPQARLEFAVELAVCGDLNRAEAEVEAAYGEQPGLRDGYANLGRRVLAPGEQVKAALAMFRRDYDQGRLSAQGMIQYAQLMGRLTTVGAEDAWTAAAADLVERAYASDPGLRNGYVAVAGAFRPASSPEQSKDFFDRDMRTGRMDLAGFKRYLIFLFSLGELETVIDMIGRAYGEHPEYTDCYVCLAEHCVKQLDAAAARDFFELELAEGRMTTMGRFSYSMFLLRNGDPERAQTVAQGIPETDSHHPLIRLAFGGMDANDTGWCLPTLVAKRAASLAMGGDTQACQAYADRMYLGVPDSDDLLSCCARAALAEGDGERAKALFQADVDRGRARWDSMLQYAETLTGPARERVEEAAFGKMGLPVDSWLRDNRNRHLGETCFVVGTGPSMRGIDCSLLRGRSVMAVNGAIYLDGLEATYFVSVSDVFWRHHREALRTVSCRRFLPAFLRDPLEGSAPTSWLNAVMPRIHDAAGQLMPLPLGFSLQPHRFVALGGTVMVVCLQLAWYLGFDTVVLLGVDHNYGSPANITRGFVHTNDYVSAHFMKDYYKSSIFYLDFSAMDRGYRLGEEAFRSSGRRVVNATPGTKLDVYPKVDLQDMLEGITV